MECKIEYYENGQLKSETYYKHDKIHRDNDKPAIIEYFHSSGNIQCEYYSINGEYSREGDKPAIIEYYNNGNVYIEHYYKNGKIHRKGDLPYFVIYFKNGEIQMEEYKSKIIKYTEDNHYQLTSHYDLKTSSIINEVKIDLWDMYSKAAR